MTFLQRGPQAQGGSDSWKAKSSMGTGPTVEGSADAAQGWGMRKASHMRGRMSWVLNLR